MHLLKRLEVVNVEQLQNKFKPTPLSSAKAEMRKRLSGEQKSINSHEYSFWLFLWKIKTLPKKATFCRFLFRTKLITNCRGIIFHKQPCPRRVTHSCTLDHGWQTFHNPEARPRAKAHRYRQEKLCILISWQFEYLATNAKYVIMRKQGQFRANLPTGFVPLVPK